VLAIGKHAGLLAGVTEWQPLTWHAAPGWHWLFLLSLLLLLATHLWSRGGLTVTQLLLVAGVGVATCCQQRMFAWWAMIVPWVLVPHWAQLTRDLGARTGARPLPADLRKTLLAVAVVFAVVMWSPPVGWLLAGGPRPVEGAVSSGTPWQLAHQLKSPSQAPALPALQTVLDRNYPDGRFTGAIFASPMQGDYLMWALAPDVAVSYTHMHLFPPAFWAECGTVASGGPGWWDVLERNRVNLVAIEAEEAAQLRRRLQEDAAWEIVLDETGDPAKPYAANRQLIAVRRKPL
jgi:hypothetical protein